jgi:glycosyltransferase, family 2
MKRDQIAELLAVSIEGVNYIARAADVHDRAAEDILTNLRQIAVLIEKETGAVEGLFRQVHLYAKNIQASLDDLNRRPDLYERIVRMELRPFVLEMQRLWELGTEILSSAVGRAAYRAQVMKEVAALHDALPREYLYDVSIVLLAYNKLEYTRRAAESILAHTDFSRGNIQWILLNNGSDDELRTYFESIPHAKVMNLRHNILGTFAYTHILEGKYFVGFSNDIVATPHWLDHLLACMESDDRIGIAVPTCNEASISNDQGIPVSYPNTFAGMEEMQAFAAAHNHLNPKLWENRSQLMPFLHIMPRDLILLCAADPVFTRAEFVDDDLSTLLRRNGWRQLLLKDTFMHHFGGVTLGEGRKNEAGNALDAMRRVYYEKWGVDAWDSRGTFIGVEDVWSWHTLHEHECALILEPRFGDLACALVNAYRRSGFTPHMTAAVFDRRYLPDTDYIFDETMTVAEVEEIAVQSAGQYDIISAGCYLDELPVKDIMAAIEQLYGLLAEGGALILPVRNPSSAYELAHVMNMGRRDTYCGEGEVTAFTSIPHHELLFALHVHPYLNKYKIYVVSFAADVSLAEQFLPLMAGDTEEDARKKLLVRMFFLGIFKKA